MRPVHEAQAAGEEEAAASSSSRRRLRTGKPEMKKDIAWP